MIITLNEFKTLANITDSNSDQLINTLLPNLEAMICDYCKNDFINGNDLIISNNFVFSDIDNSVSSINADFADYEVNDTVRFYNTLRNDFAFTIESVSANKLIFNPLNRVVNETSTNSIKMTRVVYPRALKSIVVDMLKYSLEDNAIGILEEKIDDYTIKFGSNIGSIYPSSIMAGLNLYRRLWRKCL